MSQVAIKRAQAEELLELHRERDRLRAALQFVQDRNFWLKLVEDGFDKHKDHPGDNGSASMREYVRGRQEVLRAVGGNGDMVKLLQVATTEDITATLVESKRLIEAAGGMVEDDPK